MAKIFKILFIFFMFGVITLPQQFTFAQEINTHEVCCCSTNDEHQAYESSTECCGTSCQDCSISHSNHISVFFISAEDFQEGKIFLKQKNIPPYKAIFLQKNYYSIWQPPKID